MAVNQRKIGTILSYVTLVVTNTISLFYTPLYLTGLGQRQYGLFGTANSLTSYLSLLSFGIAGAYIKFNMEYRMGGDKEGEKRLNGMFLSIYTVLSGLVLIAGAIMICAAPYVFNQNYTKSEIFDIQIIMACTIACTMVTFIFNVVAMALLAYEEFIFIRLCTLCSGVISPILNLILVYCFNGKATLISIGTLVVSVVQYSIYFVYAKKRIKIGFIFRGIEKKVLVSVFVFSSFLLLNSITDMITNSTDNLILGIVSGPVAVAVYSIASNFKNYFLTFSTSVSNVFAPQVNRIVANYKNGNTDKNIMDKDLNELFQKIGRIQNMIVSLVLIGFIFIGHQFIDIWAGTDYSNAYYIALFLFIGLYVPCFQNVGLEIQKAKNLHKARSIVYLLVAIINIILTIPFARLWEGIGAALATCLCMLGGNFIFMNIYYHKKIGLNIVDFWKQILKLIPGYIIPCIVGVLIKYFYSINNYSQLLIAVFIMLATYVVSVWFLSMNNYERNLLKGPFKKFAGKIRKK